MCFFFEQLIFLFFIYIVSCHRDNSESRKKVKHQISNSLTKHYNTHIFNKGFSFMNYHCFSYNDNLQWVLMDAVSSPTMSVFAVLG